ncbi:MAG: HEPN domain-containing protein, partial [Thermoproteota archaeon]
MGLSGDRVNVIKERAGAFLELARDLLGKGRLDIASFNVHQASQLRVKAALLRLVGETPRVHGLRELLGMLAKRLEELNYSDLSNKIVSFVRMRRDHLIDVETAYVESRYGIAEETIENLRMMINVAEELLALLDQVEKDVL